ncbi:hypothetical protein L7F22_026635 [Adiantum nelumboides]|nr:hypothetical protein [Adiantum nelumboides]
MWALRGSSCWRWRLSSFFCRGQQQSRSLHADPHSEELNSTPWVRTVQSGIDLLRNPKYNKGMSFSKVERDRNHLHGLLPPAYMSQDLQVL